MPGERNIKQEKEAGKEATNFFQSLRSCLREDRISPYGAFADRNCKKWDNIVTAWEGVFGTFPDFPRQAGGTLAIYREMDVENPKETARKIKEGETRPGEYWAFCEEGANTYLDPSGSEAIVKNSNIHVEAEVPLEDIDPAHTLAANYHYPEECEVKLTSTDRIKVNNVKWKTEGKEIRVGNSLDWRDGTWHEIA